MDRLVEILQERASRLSVTAGCLHDLLAVLGKSEYQATPADVRALKYCKSDGKRLPKMELTVGMKGIRPCKHVAIVLGNLCLILRADTLNAELEAILRRRDGNHHLLKWIQCRAHSFVCRQLPDRSGLPGRIDTPGYEKQKQSTATEDASTHTVTAGDELWKLSDPFGICFQQDANVSGPGAVKDAAKSMKAQERNQQRQELHKARQEARKQHQEGQLSDDP